jgi:hypothetical protein
MQLLGRSQDRMPKNEDADVDADIELARKTVLVAQIKRKERMQAILDYIGLIVRIVFGLTSLIVGTLEFFDPTLLPINYSKPEIYIAIGLSFLSVSERVISKIEKVAKALKS